MSREGMSRLRWWVGGIAAGVAALALVAAALLTWVVPGIAVREASKGMEAATGRNLSIRALAIHPFTWKVEIRDVALSEVGGKGTFASFERAEASVGLSSLWKGAPVIYGVRLVGPHFNAIRTAPNVFNFSDLLKYLEAPVPTLTLEDVAITGGSIDFEDRVLARPERHLVKDAELVVPFLTTVPSRASEFGNPRFHAVIDGAPLTIESKVRGLPGLVEASAAIDLSDLSLPVYLSYVPAEIPVNVRSGKLAVKGTVAYRVTDEHGGELAWDGTVDLTGIRLEEKGEGARLDVGDVTLRSRVTSGQKRGLRVEDAALEVRRLAVPFAGKDGVEVHRLAVEGVTFASRANQLEVASILLDAGRVRASRDAKGRLSSQGLVDGLQRRMPRASGTSAPPRSAAPPLEFRVASIEGKGIDLLFTDRSRRERPVLSLTGVHVRARDVTGPRPGKVPFEVSAHLGKDATVRAAGWAVAEPLAVDAAIDLRNLDLSAAAPYVNERARLVLAGGRLDLSLRAAVARKGDKLGGTVKGSTAVRALEVQDARRGKLLAWKALSVEGIDVVLEPARIAVAKVTLDGLRLNLVQGKDGKTNLPRPDPAPATGDGKAPAPAVATGKPVPARKGLQTPVRIDEVVVKDGAIDFTDESVPGPFRAPVRDLDVRVTGMTTEPGKEADVKVRMTLPKGAPLTVAGKAAPLKEPATADVHLVIDRLDLTAAQPYANTFLGLDVDRGTLTVDARAKVLQGKLAAENRIRVDQLTYGKAVKSDKATFLPVRMLTDILRDREGNIVLDLPVTARTDDPEIAGTIVGQVVKDVLFPPGSPLRSVPFDPCSDALGDGARDRLRKLAEALGERPAMKIVALGFVDPEKDRAACAERVAAEKASRASPPVAQPGAPAARPAG
ncbi:MAG TPA: DUF748 domain-containing protein, partial [Anaeromyxobacteraceae bacterium]|nr:DUF748 domain-containing protein [Anaeromyxobacteraceae bacterium]